MVINMLKQCHKTQNCVQQKSSRHHDSCPCAAVVMTIENYIKTISHANMMCKFQSSIISEALIHYIHLSIVLAITSDQQICFKLISNNDLIIFSKYEKLLAFLRLSGWHPSSCVSISDKGDTCGHALFPSNENMNCIPSSGERLVSEGGGTCLSGQLQVEAWKLAFYLPIVFVLWFVYLFSKSI